MTVQQHLKDTYTIVNDLIKFAEAKNAGLIAFNGAISIGLLSLLSSTLPELVIWLIAYAIGMNLISLFVALSAVSAQMRPKEITQEITANDNLIFFGTIARMIPSQYHNALVERYQLTSENHLFERDLARQIVIVSQIAARKFNRFNWALGFTFAGILTPIAVVVHLWYFSPNRKAHGI